MKLKKIRNQFVCDQFCPYRSLHYCNRYKKTCLSCDFHEKVENIKFINSADKDQEIKSQLACLECINQNK